MVEALTSPRLSIKPSDYEVIIPRGGAVAARRAHNPKVVGSNPTPATKQLKRQDNNPMVIVLPFMLLQIEHPLNLAPLKGE